MLPEHITIPAAFASALEIGAELTAIDLATFLIVGWYAARRDGEQVDIPEKALRQALFGPGRAPDGKRDGERLARLAAAQIFADERFPDLETGVPAPTIEHGMRRILVDGSQRWTVDPALRAAFRSAEDEEVIQVPTEMLRRARCRFTTLLYIKVAAWVAGELDRKWIRRATEDKLLLRMPLQAIREAVGFEGDPSELQRYVLAPAFAEINTLTDLYLDAVLIRAPSRRGIGKVMGVDLLIGRPVLVEPKRARKPKPVEVLPDNVVRLPVSRRITRGVVASSDENIEF